MGSCDIMPLWEGEKPKGLGDPQFGIDLQSFVSFGTLKSLHWDPSNSFNKGHLLY